MPNNAFLMLSREEKYIYEWETRRGKGKWSYVILTALIWGTIFPCVIKAFKLAFRGQLSFTQLKSGIFNQDFFYTWAGFVIGFFCFALLMWRLAKKKYEEFKRKQVAQTELYFDSRSAPVSEPAD